MLQRFAAAAATDEGSRALPAIVAAPALRIPGRAILPDGMFAVDVVTVHPAPGRRRSCSASARSRSTPIAAGTPIPHQLATTRAQAGVYVHALRLAVDAAGVGGRGRGPDEGFLVLTRPGIERAQRARARGPALPGEAGRARLRAAARGGGAGRGAARRRPTRTTVPKPRLAVVADAPKAYDEACVSFCELEGHCHARRGGGERPAVLGRDVARFLGAIPLARAAALLDGERAASPGRGGLRAPGRRGAEGWPGEARGRHPADRGVASAARPSRSARPCPGREPTAADRLIVAFVRMAGEARPWGSIAGHPGERAGRPHRARAARRGRARAPRARRSRAPAARTCPTRSGPPRPTGPTSRAVATRRQLWMPGSTHVEMLHLLDYRFSRGAAPARRGRPARSSPRARAGVRAGSSASRPGPGQVRVFDATRRLRDAFAVPAEDVRQPHLGFLLAWLAPEGGTREARLAAARLAEAEVGGRHPEPRRGARHARAARRPAGTRTAAIPRRPPASPRRSTPCSRPSSSGASSWSRQALDVLEDGSRPPNPEPRRGAEARRRGAPLAVLEHRAEGRRARRPMPGRAPLPRRSPGDRLPPHPGRGALLRARPRRRGHRRRAGARRPAPRARQAIDAGNAVQGTHREGGQRGDQARRRPGVDRGRAGRGPAPAARGVRGVRRRPARAHREDPVDRRPRAGSAR